MTAQTPERAAREALERFAIDGQWLTAPDEASLNMRAELLTVKRHARKWLAVIDAQDAEAAPEPATAATPGHYREAERLAGKAADYEGLPSNHHVHLGQLSQVHALLALADAVREQTKALTAPVETPERDW